MKAPIYRGSPGASSPFELQMVGVLESDGSFTYDSDYLQHPTAAAISQSLPLRAEPYAPESSLPYFQGLLPEGSVLASLAAAEGKLERDYIDLLVECGLDCVGDVVINPNAYRGSRGYESVSLDSLHASSSSGAEQSGAEMARVHLSLAGTQSKFGLYHDWSKPIDEAWFRPRGGAPSNVIAKVPSAEHPRLVILEQIAMSAAAACGLRVARTALVNPENPLIISERFDREVASDEVLDGVRVPMRAHQEDFTQVFGMASFAKYEELSKGTYASIAGILRSGSSMPAADIRELVSLVLFNYLIGNCDNHLKNISILYSHDWKSFRLAPAYDIVPTIMFGEFSEEMGMAIGGVREISEVHPSSFEDFAKELRIKPALVRRAARTLLDNLPGALSQAGNKLESAGFRGALYQSDNLQEDVSSRWTVLDDFCG